MCKYILVSTNGSIVHLFKVSCLILKDKISTSIVFLQIKYICFSNYKNSVLVCVYILFFK